MQNDSSYIAGSGLLAFASWATSVQPIFSVFASIGAILLAIFGIANYIKKWKQQKN